MTEEYRPKLSVYWCTQLKSFCKKYEQTHYHGAPSISSDLFSIVPATGMYNQGLTILKYNTSKYQLVI